MVYRTLFGVLIWGASAAMANEIFLPLFLDDPIVSTSVWTPSPLIVWNELEKEYFKEKMDVVDDPSISNRLRRGDYSRDLCPDGVFDMQVCFRTNEYSVLPAMEVTASVQLNCLYKQPFAPAFVDFPDKSGGTKRVPAFGFYREENRQIRKQASILYFDDHDNFAVSLNTSTPSNLVVVALMREKPHSLAEGVNYIQKRMKQSYPISFGPRDELRIPEIRFSDKFNYDELEGKSVRIGSARQLRIIEASKVLDFSFTRFGIELDSQYTMRISIGAGSEAKQCIVNSPFLIFMKVEGKDNPYFAAWIDDPEHMSFRKFEESQKNVIQ